MTEVRHFGHICWHVFLNTGKLFSLFKAAGRSLELDIFNKYIEAYRLSIYVRLGSVKSGGVLTVIAMHCGCRIFKMAMKVEKLPRLYALFFDRHSFFVRKFSTVP